MGNFLLILARMYPVWATPLCLTLFSAGVVLLKKKHKSVAFMCIAWGIVFGAGVVLFVFFGGHSKFVPLIYDYVLSPNALKEDF